MIVSRSKRGLRIIDDFLFHFPNQGSKRLGSKTDIPGRQYGLHGPISFFRRQTIPAKRVPYILIRVIPNKEIDNLIHFLKRKLIPARPERLFSTKPFSCLIDLQDILSHPKIKGRFLGQRQVSCQALNLYVGAAPQQLWEKNVAFFKGQTPGSICFRQAQMIKVL